MLRIKYEVNREDFYLKEIVRYSKKVPDGYASYTKEYTELYEFFNKQLQDAFDAGRKFEREYKQTDD